MTGATSVALLTGTAAPAAADPTVTQQAVLIKDKSPYKLTYHEHIDGIGQGDEVCYFGAGDGCAKYPPNAGKVNYSVKMYRLKERERRYDYYFVDVTANTYARKGDGDKGRMSITLDPTSKVNLTTNVYSKNTLKDDCHTYPLEIGVGLGPFSAGTTVANFSTCDKADIHTTKLASNAVRYDIYSLNRFRNWTVQKWVRVAKGAKPRFKVTVRLAGRQLHRAPSRRQGVRQRQDQDEGHQDPRAQVDLRSMHDSHVYVGNLHCTQETS